MRTLIHHAINKQERLLGASLDWLREVAQHSRAAFWKFALTAPLGNHRKRLPKDGWHLARLAATQLEDCGACVQIVVNLALNDGVSPDLLRAALRNDLSALPAELADVIRFTRTIASGSDDPELRDELKQRYGEEAFLELALAIATSRLIPTTKRALGHAQSCSLVKVNVGGEKSQLSATASHA